ncbi:uncharacterized protein LOC116613059 [Nematostella vectensis]|uniref:uncharacterized protein LOC116613059 n=1 Tax=Nematostella vectensis TaxID=45351 RepID=UPI0020778951|nr:uncharacterized protein LOC116613059 [Nematostella vectensis]
MTSKRHRVFNSEEQICSKLQNVLSLCKDLQRNGYEGDDFVLLAIIRDMKIFLGEKLDRKSDLAKMDAFFGDLTSNAVVIALRRLVRDVNQIKDGMKRFEDGIEKRTANKMPPLVKSAEAKTQESDWIDEVGWEKIRQKREDLLSTVETSLSRYSTKARSRPKSTPQQSQTLQCSPSPGPSACTLTVDRQLTERVEKLETFLRDRRARLLSSRESRASSMQCVRDVECTIHNTESAIERSRFARKSLSAPRKKGEQDSTTPSPDNGVGRMCCDCHKVQHEKDKFWGLISDSEDDEEFNLTVIEKYGRRSRTKLPKRKVAELNRLEMTELFDTLSVRDDDLRPTTSARSRDRDSPIAVEDPISKRKFVFKKKPAGRAGRGTWATPAFERLWTMTEVDGTAKLDSMTRLREISLGRQAIPPVLRAKLSWPRRLIQRLSDTR